MEVRALVLRALIVVVIKEVEAPINQHIPRLPGTPLPSHQCTPMSIGEEAIHTLPCWYITGHHLGTTLVGAVTITALLLTMGMDGISTPKHVAIMSIQCLEEEVAPWRSSLLLLFSFASAVAVFGLEEGISIVMRMMKR